MNPRNRSCSPADNRSLTAPRKPYARRRDLTRPAAGALKPVTCRSAQVARSLSIETLHGIFPRIFFRPTGARNSATAAARFFEGRPLVAEDRPPAANPRNIWGTAPERAGFSLWARARKSYAGSAPESRTASDPIIPVRSPPPNIPANTSPTARGGTYGWDLSFEPGPAPPGGSS